MRLEMLAGGKNMNLIIFFLRESSVEASYARTPFLIASGGDDVGPPCGAHTHTLRSRAFLCATSRCLIFGLLWQRK